MNLKLSIRSKKKNLKRLKNNYKKSEKNSSRKKLKLLRGKMNLMDLMNQKKKEYIPEEILGKLKNNKISNLSKDIIRSVKKIKRKKKTILMKMMDLARKLKIKTTMIVIFEEQNQLLYI